jgi:hypothetical protein
MPDEKPTLHVDTDWKKQAQEEKKRLAEKEKERTAATSPPTMAGAPGGAPARAARDMPPASFATVVQGIVTQVLFYLGELATRGGEPMVNLDLAKHHIDTLAVLEEKTHGNLSDEEKRLLDAALYETRMRYVSVASQMIS